MYYHFNIHRYGYGGFLGVKKLIFMLLNPENIKKENKNDNIDENNGGFKMLKEKNAEGKNAKNAEGKGKEPDIDKVKTPDSNVENKSDKGEDNSDKREDKGDKGEDK